MLQFRYACQRHRQMFIDAVTREGCDDPAKMEEIRRHMFVWFAERFPSMVLDHFNAEACLGCSIEDVHIDTAEMYDAIREIVRATTSGALQR